MDYHLKLSEKLIEEIGIEVQINDTSDELFNTSVAESIAKFLQSDPNDSTAAIAKYVFLEQ